MVGFTSSGNMKEIPIGSGFKEIYLFLIKMMAGSFVFIIFLILFIGSAIITISIAQGNFPNPIIAILTIFFILFITLLTFPFIVLMMALSALIVWGLVKKGNRIHLKNGRMYINHQNWSVLPAISNSIPISSIECVQKAGDEYWKERWKNTMWRWKLLRLHPLPPKGGLYPMYATKKNLMILYLDTPVRVNNQKLGAWTRFGLTIKEYWVMEVIIDIDREFQDVLIDEIESRKSSSRQI